MVEMGYDKGEVEHSLRTRAYDDPFATYLLLGTKPSEVRTPFHALTNLACSLSRCRRHKRSARRGSDVL